MSRLGDDSGVTPFRRPLDDDAVEALLSGRAVTGEQALGDALSVLRSSVERVDPSAALAAMLASGVSPAAPAGVRPVVPGRRWALRSAVALAAVSASLLGAASANALPGPLQRAVDALVETVTPLELPGPLGDDEAPGDPVVPPGTVPGPDAEDVRTGDESRQPHGGEPEREVDGDVDGSERDDSDDGAPDGDGAADDEPTDDGPDSDRDTDDADETDDPDETEEIDGAGGPDIVDTDTDAPDTRDAGTRDADGSDADTRDADGSDTDSGDAGSDDGPA